MQDSVSSSAAAVEEAGDWLTGDSGNASLGGPAGHQAVIAASALQNAIISSRLKNKYCVVF